VYTEEVHVLDVDVAATSQLVSRQERPLEALVADDEPLAM
jgi:hypothetical protein